MHRGKRLAIATAEVRGMGNELVAVATGTTALSPPRRGC